MQLLSIALFLGYINVERSFYILSSVGSCAEIDSKLLSMNAGISLLVSTCQGAILGKCPRMVEVVTLI